MITAMFTFTLPLLLLLLTTIVAAQPYKATDLFLLNCGSSTAATFDHRTWDSDEGSKFVISGTSFSSKPSFQHPSVPPIPYSTARIFNTSSFTYKFPVTEGPKFLRLHFYPVTYSHLQADQSFFSVSANGYTLLTNFSAFLAASFIENIRSDSGDIVSAQASYFVKEFIVYVKDIQTLKVIFTPIPNSYAFINGIEIVSMPENLYFKPNSLKYVGISDDMAQETVYRLNVGGGYISGNADTGMYRSWEPDGNYIFGAAYGITAITTTPIAYTMETPNYTAPEQVYATQRSMGNLSNHYNLSWMLPVDSGFHYKIRLHFCNIIPQYRTSGQMAFTIFMNNDTAEEQLDPLYWTKSGDPVFKDYFVFIFDPDRSHSKQDLWITMRPNLNASKDNRDAHLNGLEAFKLSIAGDLSITNPEIFHSSESPTEVINRKKIPYRDIIGGVGGGLVLLSVLVLIVLWRQRRAKDHGTTNDDKPYRGLTSIELRSTRNGLSSLSSDRCRRFTLREVRVSTGEFNDNCVIGRGGFGKVYKGCIDNAKTTVAIKQLNPSSNQGFHEFQTEIKMLSKLRHAHLVSLIGFCDEDGEMVLVYDYMAHGTLQEHLYKTKNPPLPWKTRLHICIGAAQGLLYLHTSAKLG